MKRIIFIVAGIIFVLVLGAAAFLGYLGLFSSPEVTEREMGPYTFIYEEYVGPYMETGKVFDRVQARLKNEGIEPVRGLGVYFDDPAEVPAEKLRSQCGSVIEGADLEKIKKMKEKFTIRTIERSRSLVAEFPVKHSLSYMIGPMRCYPVLAAYAGTKGLTMKGEAYELYDMPENRVYYIMPVAD